MTSRATVGVVDALDLSIAREFAASRNDVFRCWIEPALLARWWGALGYAAEVVEMDVRPGGRFHTVVRGPNGNMLEMKGVFREVFPPTRLVFSTPFGSENHPSFCEVTLAERGGKTRLTVRWRHQTVADRDAHERMNFRKAWGQSLARLEEVLEAH